ncbi:hypothetical protein DSO57_1039235 [Entomophthora muscae]|uniref:Uncharacterized protein n=1 Tax=Entomophthora muscae TaxID=34485 RepID=A0ACC2U7I2_9FUNG|nr:hypothetical protein DSO57_1039235 [Entomophthora muscae]
MIGTEKGSYGRGLKAFKKEVQTVVLKEQETRPASAGRLPKDRFGLTRLKDPKIVLLGFVATGSIAFREVFGCATQGCCLCFCQACLGKLKKFKDIYKKYTSDKSGTIKQA